MLTHLKRRKYRIGGGYFRIVDQNHWPATVYAILEVSKVGIETGNVELKVYNTSYNKKQAGTCINYKLLYVKRDGIKWNFALVNILIS